MNKALTKTPVYAEAWGGAGVTGWDWVINIFEEVNQRRRASTRDIKLFINDHLSDPVTQTPRYIELINLLKSRGLIDGVGIHGRDL